MSVFLADLVPTPVILGTENMSDFKLSEHEIIEIQTTRKKANQVAFGVLYKYFQKYQKFPSKNDNSLEEIAEVISKQLLLSSVINWESSSIEKNKKDIRRSFGYKIITSKQKQELTDYLNKFIFPKCLSFENIEEACSTYFETHRIESLSKPQQTRFLKSAAANFEKLFFKALSSTLTDESKLKMDSFLQSEAENISFSMLKGNTPYLNIKSIENEIALLNNLKSFDLPETLGKLFDDKLLKKYHDRVTLQSPKHLMRHQVEQRYALLASFLYHKTRICLDNLATLLIKLIQRMRSKSEKHVKDYITREVRRVNGKFDILLTLADTALQNPKNTIEEKIYEAVSEPKLKALVEDLKYKDNWFKNQVNAKSLSLYSRGNKKMLWALLKALILKGGNAKSQTLLQACDWIGNIPDTINEVLYIDSLDPLWITFLEIKNENGVMSFNKNAYECALFQQLSLELSVKNIWVQGSLRYRDPKEDLPQDFKENIDSYLTLLKLPKDADTFIKSLKKNLKKALKNLDDTILSNKKVVIKDRSKKGAIKVTPHDPQDLPPNLHLLHQKIVEQWGSISLMDVLKETDLRLEFSKKLRSVLSSERIKKEDLNIRKLLCIYGLGTNMGMSRMASGEFYDLEPALQYVKLNYITPDGIRDAIKEVVNAVILMRDEKIWGSGLTGCACDSTKVSVWDQNLLSEWHLRYGGKGVMVYWNVDKKALIVYSQVKTCSSSEVGSMLTGVLEHDTIMEMDEIYTDTHGQSAIGFAFAYLLGFYLLPRIKNINKQKLYRVSKSDEYSNIQEAVVGTPIKWSVIKEHYEQFVECAAALKTRCVESSVLLKRLSSAKKSDPLYQAFLELGKIIRTIFLCKYLTNEDLRIDIHESLNVVERVNGVMDFIFFALDFTKRIPFKTPANENIHDTKNTHTRSRKSQTNRQVAA
ncbi:MAG: Tn3 family transposase ISNpu13 [Holosporales bacterium]